MPPLKTRVRRWISLDLWEEWIWVRILWLPWWWWCSKCNNKWIKPTRIKLYNSNNLKCNNASQRLKKLKRDLQEVLQRLQLSKTSLILIRHRRIVPLFQYLLFNPFSHFLVPKFNKSSQFRAFNSLILIKYRHSKT